MGCRRTSNHAEGRARTPVRRTVKRHRLYRCTCHDFLSDEAREKGIDGGSNVTNGCEKEEEQVQLLDTLALGGGGGGGGRR